MNGLSHHDIATFLLGVGVLLGIARLLGELALRLHQPAVLGELLAGILLGPTLLGAVAPEWTAALFPPEGPVASSLSALTTLAITLFLLVAGMEVDLSTVWRQGRSALWIGVAGMALPFAAGFFPAYFAPGVLGADRGASPLIFALFFATALSISALPVIAKTLMDLNLYRTDFGMVVMAAAIFNDLVGWIIFAMILSMIGHEASPLPIGSMVGMTVLFVLLMLTAGRYLIDRVLPWIQAHTSWPGGILGFALTLALLSAALAEWIGIHAIFGAFIFGVALGDSRHLRERTRTVIDQFVSFIFAPLFFASIGLHVNFLAAFDLMMVLSVLLIATFGKVVGCTAGAWLVGFPRREGLAVGFAMNSRGAMEIILGLLALQAGVIRERMFVALVVMALVTSMTSGIAIQTLLGHKKAKRFSQFLQARNFISKLTGKTRREVIHELVVSVCEGQPLDPVELEQTVWVRERFGATGFRNGIAIPQGRIEGLTQAIVAVGISKRGIDFDSPDGLPAHIILLLLTPDDDRQIHFQLLSDMADLFSDPRTVEKAVESENYTQFLACLKSERAS
ncbi:cation:proton antiporter domain-containing protein [Candidatus Laterigemmans baculatus]|uniref:cation:proton antiporter domain-containing protein n=1 Tax=Candidatus Laterigemmans baculatus TaxID=2770505 RepID=UPI0013DA05A9|nr:cation:proton antiporter [Candidatus Laterigemmans baculatus]